MKIADLIEKYGMNKIENAVIRDVGGDRHTGARSTWLDSSCLDLSHPEDINIEIETELPGMIFIASDKSVWRVK